MNTVGIYLLCILFYNYGLYKTVQIGVTKFGVSIEKEGYTFFLDLVLSEPIIMNTP